MGAHRIYNPDLMQPQPPSPDDAVSKLSNGWGRIALDLGRALMGAGLGDLEGMIVWLVLEESWFRPKMKAKPKAEVQPVPVRLNLSEIARVIGSKQPNVVRAKRHLVERKILIESAEGLLFNKDYTQWEELPDWVLTHAKEAVGGYILRDIGAPSTYISQDSAPISQEIVHLYPTGYENGPPPAPPYKDKKTSEEEEDTHSARARARAGRDFVETAEGEIRPIEPEVRNDPKAVRALADKAAVALCGTCWASEVERLALFYRLDVLEPAVVNLTGWSPPPRSIKALIHECRAIAEHGMPAPGQPSTPPPAPSTVAEDAAKIRANLIRNGKIRPPEAPR